jgi:hypothetical protein
MSSFHTWERRFSWLAFPGLIRCYALMHVLVYVLQIIRPDIGDALDFDRSRILSGELWRIVTCFFAGSQFGPVSPMSLLFLFFMIRFMFMVADGLEEAWGAFKTSVFCYFGMIMIVGANFLFPSSIPYSGLMVYGSVFLAFATLFPKLEIRLFLILPVSVGFLGALQGGIMLVTCLFHPSLAPFFLLANLNYLLMAGLPALRGVSQQKKSAQRKSRFAAARPSAADAFHRCEVCDRTDASHPELDFRIGDDGREFCSQHLPESCTHPR